MSEKESDVTIILPDNGIIDVDWAREQLERANLFSTFSLNANKGRVFYMLQSSLSDEGFSQAVSELDYTIETALTYISFLNKLPVLEAIKDKYFIALSLSAAELVPNDVEEAFALIDVTLARCGKPTAKNIAKAIEITGTTVKKMTVSAITAEANKKQALQKWLLDEHQLSADDIIQASKLDTTGKTEFLDKMLEAYDRLDNWNEIYKIIAKPIHDSENMKALRFLADINDASGSIISFLNSEKSFYNLRDLKEKFFNEIYPKMQFEKEQDE